MRVLLLEADEAMLAERERLGLDVRDELWDGVLHVVPAPITRHQRLEAGLLRRLGDAADAVGLEVTPETGVYPRGTTRQWRVPDLVLFAPDSDVGHGVEAPVAVIEIVSPGDTSYEKIPFYLEVGVTEVVLIDRDTLEVSVYRSLDDTGTPVATGDTRIEALDVTLTRVTDDHLRLTFPDRESDVRL